MDDRTVIEYYLKRSPDAPGFAARRFSDACYKVAFSVLRDEEKAEDCLARVWEEAKRLIPPARPAFPAAFFAKLTRDLAFEARQEEETAGPSPSFENDPAVPALNEHIYSLAPADRALLIRKDWLLLTDEEAAASLGLEPSDARQRLSLLHEGLAGFFAQRELALPEETALLRLFGRIDDELIFSAIARVKGSGEAAAEDLKRRAAFAVILLILLCALIFFLK
jgi:DNA-directed RNA polymerase specialized sigma24 family protein